MTAAGLQRAVRLVSLVGMSVSEWPWIILSTCTEYEVRVDGKPNEKQPAIGDGWRWTTMTHGVG